MILKNSESIGTNLDLIKVLMYAIMKLKANEKGKRTPDYQKIKGLPSRSTKHAETSSLIQAE